MYNKLMSWLASGSTVPFMFEDEHFKHIIVRVQKDTQIDYLFAQMCFDGQKISKRRDLQYIGLYCRKDGRIYAPEVWTEDKLISYITDPDDFAQKEVEKYLSEHQEDILLEFLMNDLLKKEYEQILVNEADPIHLIRRIMAVMSSTPAKTVNVSISKDGTELTMKVNADDLRADPGVSAMYNVWNIAAPDRREFERLFGSHAHYGPQDIAQISYGKKILYSR